MSEMQNIQWFPGHMTKTKRQIQASLKLVDAVAEILDARIPLSSKNPDLQKLIQNKPKVVLLNKCDMANQTATSRWIDYYASQGITAIAVDCKSGKGLNKFAPAVNNVLSERRERLKAKGMVNPMLRIMIVGIPNVGKSTFINSFAGKACAKTGNKPGVTKGKQWIKINKNVELLDTPGILWPKFEDQAVGLRLALIGSIKEEILNTTEMAMEFIGFLKKSYPGVLVERYSVDESKENLEILEEIARIRGCLMKGNQTDIDKAGRLLLEDFRSLRLGKLSLEVPDAQ